MNYSEVLEYLYSRLPMYQREGKSAFKKDLGNTIALLGKLGDPHRKFKSVHVAGTNGKGTSSHLLAAILQASGYKVGLYTSPHLREFTERIKINGREVSKKFVEAFTNENRESIEHIKPSFFEVTVAMAFDYFAKEKVDIAVIETGLGGRLDSTNVILPEVSLITNISLEHTDLLGDTVEKIAFEKAGIIKPKTPVVIGDITDGPLEVIAEVAQKNESRLIKSKQRNHSFDLRNVPPYTDLNLPGVLAVIEEMKQHGWKITNASTKEGVENYTTSTGLKGRFQFLKKEPLVIADVSHNKAGILLLLDLIRQLEFVHLHLIYGTVKDKPVEDILSVLPSDATLYWTQSSVPRSLSVTDLQANAKRLKLMGETFENVNDAKKAALLRAAPDDLVLITGSTFVVAEIEGL